MMIAMTASLNASRLVLVMLRIYVQRVTNQVLFKPEHYLAAATFPEKLIPDRFVIIKFACAEPLSKKVKVTD